MIGDVALFIAAALLVVVCVTSIIEYPYRRFVADSKMNRFTADILFAASCFGVGSGLYVCYAILSAVIRTYL